MNDRDNKLLELIRHGLAQHTARTSALTLGARSKYIGMSDIGAYLTCPRKAILNRFYPEQKDSRLSKLLTLNRGHWFEDGIASILKELNIPHIRQLEIGIEHEEGFEVKAHLDFVLVSTNPKPTVRILEIKSCRELPEVLYPSYEMQVYGQVGLLHRHWDGPDFSLTDENGEFQFGGLTFPEAAHHLWGIDLPDDVTFVDIEAWVLCLSMTDAKVFGPYMADDYMLDMALDLGADLWARHRRFDRATWTSQPFIRFQASSPSANTANGAETAPSSEMRTILSLSQNLKSWRDGRRSCTTYSSR